MQFKSQNFNYKKFVHQIAEEGGLEKASEGAVVLLNVGARWSKNSRPFFNVYPGVEKCLKNTKTEIDPATIPRSVLHELESMEVRFADSSDTESFFISILPVGLNEGKETKTALLMTRIDHRGIQSQICVFGNVVDRKQKPPRSVNGYGTYDIEEVMDEFQTRLRLALGIMMLAADPRFCEPILLNRDRGKIMTEEQKLVAIERAKKRNNFGFDIGREVEVSPHFRRPHFAIRWTGQGSTIPRIVPVKGAMINKALVTNIPTGFEGVVE